MSMDGFADTEKMEAELAGRLKLSPEDLAKKVEEYRELMQRTKKITSTPTCRCEWESTRQVSLVHSQR